MKGLGGAGILYIKEISDYQNSAPEPCTKEAQKQVRPSGTWRGKPEMDSNNEGTEFKETKQGEKIKEVRQVSKGSRGRGKHSGRNIPCERGGTVTLLPGHRCDGKTKQRACCPDKACRLQKSRQEDQHGTETTTSAPDSKPTKSQEELRNGCDLPGIAKGRLSSHTGGANSRGARPCL